MEAVKPMSLADAGGAGRLLVGIVLLVCGLFVATGLFTAVVQTVVAAFLLGSMSYRLLIVHDPTSVEHWQIWLFELATAVSLVLIGPGWYSVDARLFGRREIVLETTTSG
jgi:uncharacterized membrane protein YphA (DoxX/SURF4 family)